MTPASTAPIPDDAWTGFDHVRGDDGDCECPTCIRTELPTQCIVDSQHGDLCFVFPYFPLVEVHPHAELAAEACTAGSPQLDIRTPVACGWSSRGRACHSTETRSSHW